MIDLLDAGERWLNAQQLQFCAQPIRYHFNSSGASDVETKAVLSAGRVARLEDGELIIDADGIDFFIPAADLRTLPQPGDLITVIASGTVFEVLSTSTGPCYSPAGTPPPEGAVFGHEVFRVHAKSLEG